MTHGDVILEAPYFVALVRIEGGAVVRSAPILRYTLGWTVERLLAVASAKGWKVTELADE